MPSAKLIKKSRIGKSFRVEKIKGMFDLADVEEVTHTINANIPIEGRDWNIGLIVGSSGTGKTTISQELFPDFLYFKGFEWTHDSMIEDFDASISASEIVSACSSVGLSSAPDWLKPYHVLSNGQKMRADLARLVCENSDRPIIYDEFTSVVDRQVAKVSSASISKFVRKKKVRFVAVSCHNDIIEWLDPDWVYNSDKSDFSWRCLQGRPKIEMRIRYGEEKEWSIFKSYHYLNSNHHNGAEKFVAEIDNVPVAWCSVLHMPHSISKNIKRVHRLVVRPDYQGLGIGTSLLNYVGSFFKEKGFRLTITTSLECFCKTMCKNKKWFMKTHGYQRKPTGIKSITSTSSCNRLTASFEYRG